MSNLSCCDLLNNHTVLNCGIFLLIAACTQHLSQYFHPMQSYKLCETIWTYIGAAVTIRDILHTSLNPNDEVDFWFYLELANSFTQSHILNPWGISSDISVIVGPEQNKV